MDMCMDLCTNMCMNMCIDRSIIDVMDALASSRMSIYMPAAHVVAYFDTHDHASRV